ncbi:sensor histidine kinase [Nocardia goodfellowii]
MFRTKLLGIRPRVLAIALIPSLVLLAVGAVTAVDLVRESRQAKTFAQTLNGNLTPTKELVTAIERERMLSLWHLTGRNADPNALTAARGRFDAALDAFATTGTAFQQSGSHELGSTVEAFNELRTRLPALRGSVDHRRLPVTDAYAFYTALLVGNDSGMSMIARTSPTVEATLGLTRTVRALDVAESMSRTAALTVVAAQPAGLPPALFTEFRDLVGYYRTELAKLRMDPVADDKQRIEAITGSSAWQLVAAMEDALLDSESQQTTSATLPTDLETWRAAADQVSEDLLGLWRTQFERSVRLAADAGARSATTSLLTGSGVVAAAILAFLLSLWLANRLINRLRRLRTHTLALAHEALPATMRRLAAGEPVGPDEHGAVLDDGNDEIGQVAAAFNQAHAAAVAAAVNEARTREGVRAVFLNIAHRSQLVVHQQLAILDEAESRQVDPDLLHIYFRLDHLATRERRNAENLIILAGGRPGRQWRQPVPLIELVRSAIGETLDFARTQITRMPHASIDGGVVADLIHLLAELADNATSFSPPESRVEISGIVVGRGIAVEVVDQGMGMSPEDLRQANDMLADPPDFGVGVVSADSRLGLFVVAQLAARHGIAVRLSDSDYGGVLAVVLIPTALVTAEPAGVALAPDYLSVRHTTTTGE